MFIIIFIYSQRANPTQAIELKNSELLRSRPQPANYETYEEYLIDLIYWKDQV